MEVDPVKMKVTCHTLGCPVDDVTFTLDVYPNEAPPVYRVQCGQCGQPVTDLVPA